MNLREQILAADDIKREKVNVPEWGVDVYVKTMSGAERDAFEVDCLGDDDRVSRKNFRARLAVWTVTDEAGLNIFSPSDADLVGDKSAAALERIFPVAMRLNKLSKSDVEELAKNS